MRVLGRGREGSLQRPRRRAPEAEKGRRSGVLSLQQEATWGSATDLGPARAGKALLTLPGAKAPFEREGAHFCRGWTGPNSSGTQLRNLAWPTPTWSLWLRRCRHRGVLSQLRTEQYTAAFRALVSQETGISLFYNIPFLRISCLFFFFLIKRGETCFKRSKHQLPARLFKNKGQEKSRESNWAIQDRFTNFRLRDNHFSLRLRSAPAFTPASAGAQTPPVGRTEAVRGANFALPAPSQPQVSAAARAPLPPARVLGAAAGRRSASRPGPGSPRRRGRSARGTHASRRPSQAGTRTARRKGPRRLSGRSGSEGPSPEPGGSSAAADLPTSRWPPGRQSEPRARRSQRTRGPRARGGGAAAGRSRAGRR
ncbi:PREDICTED: uncharacterized protein LOC106149450, partial [Chinchilla lanigera]|uniref:uncharacterized protein LOC106149450 n=1 Tax=Chinchilla lanigera TaxID=34839 RepID=UPI000697770B